MTLHIRGVGQWTNRLYNYVEDKKKREGIELHNASMKKKKQEKEGSAEKQESEEKNNVVHYADGQDRFDLVVSKGQEGQAKAEEMLEIHLDGPFGAPASNIFR